MKTARYVEVQWDDACSCADWRPLDDLPAVYPCVTRGWLVEETKRQVVIAGTVQPSGDEVGEVIAIPRGMVTRIRTLKVSYGR